MFSRLHSLKVRKLNLLVTAMKFGLTFGSLGDIIAVSQIAIELSRTLGSAGGSTKQYQELREGLDGFVRVLMHVFLGLLLSTVCLVSGHLTMHDHYEQHELLPGLNSIDDDIRQLVTDSGSLL